MITVSAPPPKISGEQYISHSPIKLYTFDDPKIVLKHNNGFSIQHPVKPKDFVAKVLCTPRPPSQRTGAAGSARVTS